MTEQSNYGSRAPKEKRSSTRLPGFALSYDSLKPATYDFLGRTKELSLLSYLAQALRKLTTLVAACFPRVKSLTIDEAIHIVFV